MSPTIELVVLDLDGTLLDTERLVRDVTKEIVCDTFKKEYTEEANAAGLGKRPSEAAADVVRVCELPCTAEEYYALSTEKLLTRYAAVGALPGAQRLLDHCKAKGVRLALATSSKSTTLEIKLSPHGWHEGVFEAKACGDEVESGKPSPDIFLLAAERCGVDPSRCLAIEDAPNGVQSAKAAGMTVVAVPTLRNSADKYTEAGASVVVPSLLDLCLEDFGLPPFEDKIGGLALEVPAWRCRGEVIKGFGRGGKDIGCPTANLSEAVLGDSSPACGIYVGWASVGESAEVHKMVMSVGYNPYYNNSTKSVEPHLLHEFAEDFYGQELRLVVCGYLRPELNFDSFAALVEAIEADKKHAAEVLDLEPFAAFAKDEALRLK